MNYGTYTTFDCPTKKQDEAFAFLQIKFSEIGGNVRRLVNPHDFGSYQSFEVDYPTELEDIDEDEFYESDDDQQLAMTKKIWHEEANKIEEAYNKKFSNYL